MAVRIVTDSSCDLPQSRADALGIEIVPAHDPLRRGGVRRPRGALQRGVLAQARDLTGAARDRGARPPARFEERFRGSSADGADGIDLHQPLVPPVGHDAVRAGGGERHSKATCPSR